MQTYCSGMFSASILGSVRNGVNVYVDDDVTEVFKQCVIVRD